MAEDKLAREVDHLTHFDQLMTFVIRPIVVGCPREMLKAFKSFDLNGCIIIGVELICMMRLITCKFMD